jgi:subtilisin family serine protease
MRSTALFIATIITLTFGISIASPADYQDSRTATSQQIALQDATATAQIAEAIKEFLSYEVGHIVPVGLLSTGVDGSRFELKGRLLTGANFVEDEPDVVDRNGAGTYSAAVITGIASNARVLPIKVLNKLGQGTISRVVKGINFGIEEGARILLIPGEMTTKSDPGLKEAIAQARQKGILLIAAAGVNRSSERYYPGAFEEVLAVGATDIWDRKEAFSNFGDWVSLFAPWVDLRSVYRGNLGNLSTSNPEAAIVAGVATLVLGINPSLGADGTEEILLSTATDISRKNPGMRFGARRVNALAAVRAARISTWLKVKDSGSGYESPKKREIP